MRNYFHAITFAKSALAKRDNHGRKISVNGPVSGRRKEKKIPGFCKTNDCVMRNYNAFMPLRESKSSEPPKLTKTKTNQFKGQYTRI